MVDGVFYRPADRPRTTEVAVEMRKKKFGSGSCQNGTQNGSFRGHLRTMRRARKPHREWDKRRGMKIAPKWCWCAVRMDADKPVILFASMFTRRNGCL